MIELKPNEGLMEYIKRHNKMCEELPNISGIPVELMGDIRKFRPQGVAGITITGSAEFIEKFKKGIENIK